MAALEIKRKVKNGVLYTNGMIKIERVRASYPHLDKPYAGKNDEGKETAAKFGIVGMLSKSTHVEVKKLIVEQIEQMLRENKATVGKDKWFIRNGDDHEKAETYGGHWIVSARESRRPSLRNRRGELMTEKEEIAEMFYGGCYVSILIRPWYQDGQKVGKGYGKRINAGLVGVQFIDDGEPFGEGRIDDSDAWDSVDDDGDSRGDDDSDDDL